MDDLTHFERLGLPRRFPIDGADIEREYLARSRQLHPDFHQFGSDSEQRASLELSSALNEAYTILKDPFRRADYLLTLEGGPSAGERKQMPQVFLMEMLEIREQIEEQKTDPGALDRMERELNQRRESFMQEVAAAFTRLETASPADRPTILGAIRERLNAVKYLLGLIRDLRLD